MADDFETSRGFGVNEHETIAEPEVAPASPPETAPADSPASPAWGAQFRALTRASIQQLADSPAIFQRGERYLRLGTIRNFTAQPGQVSATIHGSYGDYAIIIAEEAHGLHMSCSCPYDGVVCKHMVAVLLRFVEDGVAQAPATPAATAGPVLLPKELTLEEIERMMAELRAKRQHPHTPGPVVAQPPPRPVPPPVPVAIPALLDVLRSGSLAPVFARSRYGTEKWGRALQADGRVTVQYVDQESAALDVHGVDNAHYQVSVSSKTGTLAGMQFACTCKVNRSNPYERCEHIAAAVYALRQQATSRQGATLQRQVQAAARWESTLADVLAGTKAPKKSAASRSILLFSLQEQYAGSWKLTPYTMPTALLDAAILDDRAAVQAAICRMEKQYQMKEMTYYGQPPVNPLYGSPALSSMARMVALANYHQSGNPLAFALPHLTEALLFRGNTDYYGNPFREPIRLDATPRPLQLTVEPVDAGTRLLPAFPDDDGQGIFLPDTTEIVNADPLWVLTGDRLLRIEGDGDLLRGLLDSRDIIIPPAEKKTFVTRYLPKLLHHATLADDALGAREALDVPPIARVYLSEEDETIVADLAFAYDAYEVPLETLWPETAMQYDEERELLIAIRRHREAEEAAWRAMSGFGLKREDNRFVLKQKVTPIDFLLRHVPQLQAAGYEVFGEEALKSARVNRHAPKLRMTVSSGIDWFDVLAVVSYGDLDVEMSEIRKAIKQRQGYVKLPDGSLGVLPEELVTQYRSLFALGQDTEQGVRLSKTQAMLLEFTLQGMDATVDAEYTRRVAQLRNFTQIEPRQLPAQFRGELRHYQRAGFDWLHFLHDYGFGGCLADDMGIGKTVQALVFLQSLYAAGHATAASLIVMPRSLLENWAREAARFTPDLKVLIHADGDRSGEASAFDGYHLVLTTYGVMLRDLEMFKHYRFEYLVLDEAQAIKNPAAQCARAARLLQGEHRLALTGTPVENSTEELWSLFAFLNPGQLGSQETFREQFAAPIQRNLDEGAAQALRALVHPFILRRTKEQVTPELPPRTERLIYCEMSPAQRKLYLRTRDRYRAELLGLIDQGGMQTARFKVLEGLLRLRQLANDPRLIDKTYKGTSSKFEAILESLETLREEGHQALVFSQFTSMLALLRDALDTRQWPYLYLDGQTQHRQELVDRFQTDDTIPFFLISLKAGGLGLNLTAADYVIHIDPWWNPAVERQATDRTHRIGQHRPVMVYKFIAEETVEEKILQLQEKKQALVDQLITTDGGLMKSLTRDDVAALFT